MNKKNSGYRIALFAKTLIALAIILQPLSVHAFKIDTHLWVAQQVYNDISDDGRINVKLKDREVSIPVPDQVLSAVLNHKDAFFLGNIGPDALPDVVSGQMLVHPGVSNGWKTNDWLLYLMEKGQDNPIGTALAYGYLAHASADVFSHTYVNQYAGDIFLLSDEESLVEQRHFALESFIGRYTPPYLDQNGVDQGPPHGLVMLEDDVIEYVRNTLIYDPYVVDEHSKSPYTKHLSGYVSYRNAIENAAHSETWRNIDRAVVQIIASNNGYAITAEEADALIEYLNSDIIPAVQERQDLDQERINKLNEYVNRIDENHVEVLNDTIEKIRNIQTRINEKLFEYADLANIACDDHVKKTCAIEHPFSSNAREKCRKLKCKPFYDAREVMTNIDEEVNGSGGLRDQQLEAINELHVLATTVKDSSLRITQSLIDLAQVISSDTSPVKALLDNWVMQVDVAMNEYVKAAVNSMINTTNEASDDLEHGAITPIVEWYDCYHLTIMGVPSPVGTGECGFRGELQTFTKAIEDMIHLVEDSSSLGTYVNPHLDLPTPAEFRTAVEDLQEQAKQELIEAGVDALIDILPHEIQGFIKVLDEKMDDQNLNKYFSKHESDAAPKNLIMIPDIASRIKAEMYLRADNTFDSTKYAVINNSVVLAKLAMLDHAGLTQLAEAAGVSRNIGGVPLFHGVDNLIADSVSSIDGNHHWMKVAPPYPNAIGAPYNRPNLGAGYPFPKGFGGPDTFKLWNQEVRDELFRSLFIGPLSPGIDAPEELGDGFETLLPTDYPYRPCRAHPFPDDEYDRTCGPITPVSGSETVKGIIDSVDDSPTVKGWVCATGSTDSIAYHVYVGGPAGIGKLIGSGRASDVSERAVDDACEHPGFSGNHRFSFTFSEALRREHQGKRIYIHGIRGGIDNRQLVRSGSFTLPAQAPEVVKGTIEGLYENGTVKGWVCATGSTASIDYHVYVGGPAGVGTMIGSGTASLASDASIATECDHSGFSGNHHFSYTFTDAQLREHEGKQIYIHGIRGGTDNRQLAGSGTLAVPAPPEPEVVKGIIDGVYNNATLQGWVCATGSTDSIAYHVYVGGPAGVGTAIGSGTASLPSNASVAAECNHSGRSGNHRFSYTFTEAQLRAHQGKRIYIHGIRGGTDNRQLVRSGTFTVPAPPAPPEPEVVKGIIDGVYNSSTVKGWACATGSTDSITYHVYVGGPAGSGKLVGSGRASLASDTSIAAECKHPGRSGNHRFSYTFTSAQKLEHQGKKIYIHGIRGGTANRLLVRSGSFTVPR